MTTLTLRLGAENASLLDSAVRRTGLTKSQVMRAAIEEYARTLDKDSSESFYDKIKSHVGR